MNYDQYGQCWTTCDELADMLYADPQLDIGAFLIRFTSIDDHAVIKYNSAVKNFYVDFPEAHTLRQIDYSVEEFDHEQQRHWHMPDEYKTLDIAQHILNLCTSEAELQRVGQELLLFQERNLFDLLRYLKYFVDTMRKNKILWGLGRGSSVASYVLYLLGVHKINSLYYDLPIEEFLK